MTLKSISTDYTGRRYGTLTFIGITNVQDPSGCFGWLVQCDCGNFELRRVGRVVEAHKSGLSPRCKECVVNFKHHFPTTHGLSHNEVYQIFRGIMDRCYNPKSKNYTNYGAIGISVYEPWIKDPSLFVQYMGDRPSSAHSVDRIDNDIGYFPGNLRWATDRQQNRNKRLHSHNKSGVRGVHYKKVVLKLGDVREYYVAFIRDNNAKRVSKLFSINKYGDEYAFKLACEWRLKKVEEINQTSEDKYNA